ncbi:general odorant-binding protein 84a-like [Melitaea cinxia]|uniref:general odorant-binding protein 84a-like n=1 Tax=Melitaea cinxia TaxID=113334 RepID=UPI001E2728D2|nr:general odorant-binding protein 84a-like [Melitaea cinxia]
MKTLLKIILILITFSMTKCEKKIENKMNPVVLTTAASMEDGDGKTFVDVMGVMIDCNDTFRVEMPYLDSFNKSGSFPDETDRTPKCFMRCVLEKVEVVSEDGQFDVNRTAEVFPQIRDVPQEEIIEMATPCAERSESCKCERSYQYMKCLLEKVIDKYDTT